MLYIAAFISGAGVMVLELVGSRIVAPYIGTSTFVWTSLIGIVLAGLSAGYYYGGKLADRGATERTLARIFFVAGILIFFSTVLESYIGPFLSSELGLRSAAVVISIILFGPASFCLGIVSPYIARLKLTNVENSGQTVGRLYALSTVGSIVGTFLGGFYLISYFGSMNILIGLSILFIALSLFVSFSGRKTGDTFWSKILPLAILLFFAFNLPVESKMNAITDIDTNYGRFWVYDSQDLLSNAKEPTRLLTNTIYGVQSGMYINKPEELYFDYTKFFKLSDYFAPEAKTTLMIGAGGYSYPKYFLHTYPEKTIDVVEIDKELTEISKKYFALKDDPRLQIINEDGRIFLNSNEKIYDVILLDAFLSTISIPFHLTTVEALEKVRDSLSDDGVVIANVISGITGDQNEFLRAEVATYKEVFPEVRLFQVRQAPTDLYQNLILVAGKSISKNTPAGRDDIASLLRREVPLPTDLLPVLRDDFAPVERYTDRRH